MLPAAGCFMSLRDWPLGFFLGLDTTRSSTGYNAAECAGHVTKLINKQCIVLQLDTQKTAQIGTECMGRTMVSNAWLNPAELVAAV